MLNVDPNCTLQQMTRLIVKNIFIPSGYARALRFHFVLLAVHSRAIMEWFAGPEVHYTDAAILGIK